LNNHNVKLDQNYDEIREIQPIKKDKKRKVLPKNDLHLSIIKELKPINEPQKQMFSAFRNGYNIVAHGSAGTGKSWVACGLALEELFDKSVDKIVIIRSTVSVRDQGFLPGDITLKEEPYKAPYKSIINDMCGCGTAWDTLIKKGMIQFISTSYVRGITLDNCIIIMDEVQNFNWQELNSVMTRFGKNCRVFILGDTKQNDLVYKKNDKSAFEIGLNILSGMPEFFDIVLFSHRDIVRSELVKKWIIESEKYHE